MQRRKAVVIEVECRQVEAVEDVLMQRRDLVVTELDFFQIGEAVEDVLMQRCDLILLTSKRVSKLVRSSKASALTEEMALPNSRILVSPVTSLKAFAGMVVSEGDREICRFFSPVSPAKSPGTTLALL